MNLTKVIAGGAITISLIGGVYFIGHGPDDYELPSGDVLLYDSSIEEVIKVPRHATATSSRAVIVEHGIVTNIVVVNPGWSGRTGEWKPQQGTAVLSDVGNIGDYYFDGHFYQISGKPE